MKKYVALFLLVCGCTSHKLMTMDSFSEIQMGTSKKDVTAIAGSPYRIDKKKDGSEEYVYVERFKNGFRTVEERHYIFVIKDDRVTGKRVEQSSPPPYNLNSYDLQTTYGDEVSSLEEEDEE